MITNEIYFFKNQSSVSTSDYLYNVNDGTLILQVDGDVSNLELLVLGNTDLVDDDFVTLKTINASDYNMSDKITSTGIYWVDINGLRKIKLNLSKITGSVSVKAITKRGLTTDLVARAMAANAAAGGGDYYTKEETDNKLDNKQDKINRFYIVDCKNTLGDSFDEIMNIYDTDILNQLTNIMNECYTNGYKSIAILFSGKNSFIAYARHGSDFSTQRYNYYLYGYLNLEDTYDAARIYTRIVRTEINGTWNNNVFTTKGLFLNFGPSLIVPDTSQVLTKTNTKSYTPTDDYNPATKKYVDDNKYTLPMASASTLGGIKIGDNLTIDENGVLSASGGTEVLPIYNVECDISNGSSPNWYDSSSDFAVLTKKAINEAYNKGDLHFILNYGSSSNSLGTTLQVVVKIYDTNRPIAFDTIRKISYMGGIYKQQLISLNYGSWVYANGEWTYPTGSVGAQFITDVPFMTDSSALSTFLSKTNTKSYTPTNDYNPATKKYVDDAVASAGGGSDLIIHHFSISNSLSNIFKSINSQIYIRDESIINNLINKLNEALNVGCQINLIVDFTDSSIRDIPVRLSFNPCNVLKASNSNKTLYFSSYISNSAYNNLSGYAECIIVEILMDCIFTNNVITSFQDNVFKISVTPIRLLPTDNTISYTPTNDYNPATKKYVDDTIASAITTSLEGSY